MKLEKAYILTFSCGERVTFRITKNYIIADEYGKFSIARVKRLLKDGPKRCGYGGGCENYTGIIDGDCLPLGEAKRQLSSIRIALKGLI